MDLNAIFGKIPPGNIQANNLGNPKYGNVLYPVKEMINLFHKATKDRIKIPGHIFNNAFVEGMQDLHDDAFIKGGKILNIHSFEVTMKISKDREPYHYPYHCFSNIPVKFDKGGRPRCAITGKSVSYEAMGWPKSMRMTKELIAYLNDEKVEVKKKAPPPPPKKDIRAELEKECNPFSGAVCSYAIQRKSGDIRLQVRDICHARIPEASPVHAFAANVAIQERGIEEKLRPIYREWVKWMLNEGPCKDVFITKNVNEAFDKGILFDVEKTVSQVAVAAVMLRTMHEHKYFVIWDRLVKDGVNPFYAWVVCSCITHKTGIPQQAFNVGWHHVMLAARTSLSDVHAFFKNGPKDLGERPYSKGGGFYSINKSFGISDKEPSVVTFLNKHLKVEMYDEDDGWGGKVTVNGCKYESILKVAQKLEASNK